MILSTYLFKRVTIIGVGLMGGSLGKALKKNKIAREVTGLAQKQSTLVSAIKQKAIDVGETDIKKAVRNADLIVLATPVESIIKLLSAINPHVRRGVVVTDLGSAKTEIVEAAEKVLTSGVFIGSHPLAGSEKKGVEFATEDLFTGKLCILTPTKKANSGVLSKLKQMWKKVGAQTKEMSAEEHDEVLAYISHLPHLLAFSLMNTVPDKYIDFASSGLKDTTRIASSSAQMWNDIFLSNTHNVLKSLDEMIALLAKYRKAIVRRDSKLLIQEFTQSKEKRDRLS